MTAPNVAEDPRVAELRAIGRQRGYSEQEIDARLQGAGLLQSPVGGLGSQLAHGAGLIGRMAVQGVGNLASMPFGVAGSAYQAATGNQPPAMLQGGQGTAAANQMGLPQPQGSGERIASAVGEGAISSAVLPGATPGLIGLGGAAQGAGQAAGEAGAGPLGQMAASAVVGFGIPVVHAIGAEAIRSLLAGSSTRRQIAQQSTALMQADNPDAAMSLGQVTTGGLASTVQGGLRNVPGATEVLKRSGEQQASEMQGRVGRMADRLGSGASPTVAGAAVQRGIEEGYIPRFKAVADKMYSRVFNLVPPSTPIMATNAVNLATSSGNLAAAARPLSDHVAAPKVAGILNDLAETMQQNPQGIPFGVLKELRSRLGAMLNGDELVADVNLRDVKRLYGALSEDMKAGIAPHGPAATAAWDKAEAFWKQGSEKISNILQPLMDKKTPEKAFTALMSGTRDGATVLQSTMRSLNSTERGLVQATVLKNLGKANPSAQDAASQVFSPETYLTNWNKLAGEAKTALFERADPTIVRNLDALAKAMDLRRKAANVLPNRSGTASNTAFMAILAGLPMAGYGAATGNVSMMASGLAPATASFGANLTAKAFTSPRIIQWLVKQTKVPFGAMGQELALLAKDSQKWPSDERDAAMELSSTLGHVDWNSVLLAHAAADATTRRTP